jgi:hypothetical protein
MESPKLITLWDTYLKRLPKDSAKLSDNEKIFIEAGSELTLNWHMKAENNHVKFSLAEMVEGYHDWFLYDQAGKFTGNEADNNPKETYETPKDTGPQIIIPGITRKVGINEAIISGGNFTWAEATKNGNRIPVDKDITYNIVRIAEYMEDVREVLGGGAIRITSWYRDPATNRRVGGASRSRHLSGDAVDFYCDHISVSQAYAKLNPWHGGQGGLAVKPGSFLHIDGRQYFSRWTY